MVVTLTGNNEYLIKKELQKLTAEYMKDNDELSIEIFEADSEPEKIYEAFNNVDLLSANKLVILHKLSTNKQFAENIENTIKSLPQSTNLILVEPFLDKRLSFYKFVLKSTELKDFSALREDNIVSWVIDYVVNSGGQIDAMSATYLRDRAGTNQLKLSNELNKLLLYNATITEQSITDLVEDTNQNDIFDLLDAAFSKKSKQAFKIFSNLRLQKIEPPQIIGMLAWQLNLLATLKFAGNKSNNQIASDMNRKPFFITKNSFIAQKISLASLKNIIGKLINIDIASKTQNIDSDEALKNYILELSNL